jgi:hypothetical protein
MIKYVDDQSQNYSPFQQPLNPKTYEEKLLILDLESSKHFANFVIPVVKTHRILLKNN